MNPRIKELASQCWDQRLYGKHFDQEMFAQLIILECAGLFEVEWGEEKLTGNDVGYVVKKHFGVEQ